MENRGPCPHCGAIERQYKCSTTPRGTKRYQCCTCRKTYSINPLKRGHGYTEEVRTAAINAYNEGKSGREVGRLFGMARSNAARWIKERAAQSPPDSKNTEKTAEPIGAVDTVKKSNRNI